MKKNLKIKDYVTKRKDLVDVEGEEAGVDSNWSNDTIKYTGKDKDGNIIEKEGIIAKKDRLYITITPEIREKVMKGISLFSVGAIATEGMLEEKEPVNGY